MYNKGEIIMETYANQRVIVVNKEDCDKKNLYATINLEAMDKAAIDLSGNAFKLWIYFAKNQNNYKFALSSKELSQHFGLKIDAYNKAWNTLVEKGYLINSSGNYFIFTEIPHPELN